MRVTVRPRFRSRESSTYNCGIFSLIQQSNRLNLVSLIDLAVRLNETPFKSAILLVFDGAIKIDVIV